MTYPTKAIYKHVLGDSLKVYDGDKVLFDNQDIANSLEKIFVVNYHQEVEVNGIKFTCYAAGHVLGACMFLIDIGGTKVLYTGDYSREDDRHIRGAEIPNTKVDVLIVESTYGIKEHDPQETRERMFVETVKKIVKRNGHCLLPVFVLGRAQEILLILEEYWNNNPDLKNIPIFYASTLMAKCMTIFQTYINMMGEAMKESFKRGINPFDFKNISTLKNIDSLDNSQPSVVMASPGMLQKGLSRTLFEKWCSCEKNGVVFTGYCVESTLAREILSGKKEIKTSDGAILPIKMTVDYISFSAHADFVQTRDFIKTVDPTQVILVHGESHEADRMRKELEVTFPHKQIFVPKNWQVVEISFDSKIVLSPHAALQARGQAAQPHAREAAVDARPEEKRRPHAPVQRAQRPQSQARRQESQAQVEVASQTQQKPQLGESEVGLFPQEVSRTRRKEARRPHLAPQPQPLARAPARLRRDRRHLHRRALRSFPPQEELRLHPPRQRRPRRVHRQVRHQDQPDAARPLPRQSPAGQPLHLADVQRLALRDQTRRRVHHRSSCSPDKRKHHDLQRRPQQLPALQVERERKERHHR